MARELKEILTLGTKGSARRAAATHASRLAGPLSGLYLSQLIPALLLVVIGVITIWSASISIPEANFVSHLAGIAIGLVAAVLVWRYDMRALSSMTTALFVLACILMVLPRIPGLGYEVNGMMGWVRLGPVRFQPSEPSKIVVIFLMASAAAQYNGKIETFKDYARLCGTLLVPLLLIMTLDLGTGLVIFFIGATIIIVSGAPRTWVLLTIALIVGVAAVVIITSMIDGLPHILKEYQLNRLIVFVNPDVDPTNNGYNLMQAMIAVGSGGFFGKGFGNATQALNGFVPEAQTDFVFSLFAEQFGFVGSLVLLSLFTWMIVSTVLLAMKTESMYMRLILVGCVGMWTFQVLENVGMCLGIMPITGIPLPFVSYGSSSMVVQLVSVGIVQSVWRHRLKAA